MPRGDGTGPAGQGAGTGRGRGGRGRGPGRGGGGPSGNCICPQCGKTFPHVAGQPCLERKCPDCGIPLVRQQ